MTGFLPAVAPRSALFMRALTLLSTLVAVLAGPARADSSATPPKLPGKSGLEQKLNALIPLELMFRDEAGRVVRLKQLFHGRPVLLTFMYYRCPMLCSVVQEGMVNTLTEMKLNIGRDFDIINVSFDPRDTPQAAAAKKEHYLRRYGRFEAADNWHFLTSNESAIRKLTDSVGFQYAYDPKMDQFAHSAAIMVLTPEGRVSRYFPGFEFRPRDLRLGLVEASENKIGTFADQALLLCYHYDPATGKYSRTAMNFVRAGGIATIMSLGGFIFVMVRGERKREKRERQLVAGSSPAPGGQTGSGAADPTDETITR